MVHEDHEFAFADAKLLLEQYPQKSWILDDGISVVTYATQVSVWTSDKRLMAKFDIKANTAHVFIGEDIDIENAIQDALQLAIDSERPRPLWLRMLTSWVTTVCLLVMVITCGAISYHKYQNKQQAIVKDPVVQQRDDEFRACIRKAVGPVNVASADQINGCVAQVNNKHKESIPVKTKHEPTCFENPIYPFGTLKEYCF
jgi:hypothetical protein